MHLSRRALLTACAAGFTARLHGQPIADPTETIDLWQRLPDRSGPPPVEVINQRSRDPLVSDRVKYGIAQPHLVVFRPARPNGAAVVILPGGGYRWVVVDKEGFEFARWLVLRGVTAFVLFYRLPGEGWSDRANVPLADAQRAIRMIRARASTLEIDPSNVSAVGFSAGGHACADLVARHGHQVYAPTDRVDLLSARPDTAGLMYPVISMTPPHAHAGSREQLLGDRPSPALEQAHSPHLHVTAEAPPCFLLHAEDDASVPVSNTLLMRDALQQQKVSCETHLFDRGGHGFGLRLAAGKPVEPWPDLWWAWHRRQA